MSVKGSKGGKRGREDHGGRPAVGCHSLHGACAGSRRPRSMESQFRELNFLQGIRNCRKPRARVISQHSCSQFFKVKVERPFPGQGSLVRMPSLVPRHLPFPRHALRATALHLNILRRSGQSKFVLHGTVPAVYLSCEVNFIRDERTGGMFRAFGSDLAGLFAKAICLSWICRVVIKRALA